MDSNTNTENTSSAANTMSTEISDKSSDVKSGEETNSTQSDPSVTKPEIKDNSKYKKVVSKYMQSTQDWVDKRKPEAGNQIQNRSQGQSSRNASRNPTPERRKKVSTPKTSEKPLNMSGVSVINKVDDKLLLPDFKYGKPLITGRRSLAPRKLAFLQTESSKTSTMASTSRAFPISIRQEPDDTKRKEFETAIADSIRLQSAFLLLKAKRAQKSRRADAKDKLTKIWKQSNEIRTKMVETQKYIQHMEGLLQSIDILEKEESKLKEYLAIREQTDSIFIGLAQLIDSQKRMIKLENCSEDDFQALDQIMKDCVVSERLESTEKASLNLENTEKALSRISCLENQLTDNYNKFTKCVTEVEKYSRIKEKLNHQKYSIKKLF